MNRKKLVVLIGVISNACAAQQVITVMDDHTTPVSSIVFVDGMRLGFTDEYGVLSVTDEQCGGGAKVTGEPIDGRADYISPSSTGHCTGDPVNVVLTRRIVLVRAQQWGHQASDNGNWGVAAHALNEQYGLIRDGSPEEAEQVKRNVLVASARVVGVNPVTAVRFDSAQNTFVMDESFRRALLVWKNARGLEDPTANLDYQFFHEASERSSADILYRSPE